VVTPTRASLCVEVTAQDQGGEQGQAVSWAVTIWATGGSVPNVKIQLATTPSGSGSPDFSQGCGSDDGTAACGLGTVASSAAQRQLMAEDTVPLDAATVSSVSLIATGSGTGLGTDPLASADVVITAPATPVGATTTTLPTAGVPGVSSSATLSPGGSASGLFPTVSPNGAGSPGAAGTPGASTGSGEPGSIGATPVADVSAVGKSSSALGPQVVGLAVLGVALLLAVARVSVRRPAAAGTSAATGPGASGAGPGPGPGPGPGQADAGAADAKPSEDPGRAGTDTPEA
jgi:hypothetical protein